MIEVTRLDPRRATRHNYRFIPVSDAFADRLQINCLLIRFVGYPHTTTNIYKLKPNTQLTRDIHNQVEKDIGRLDEISGFQFV